MTPCQFTENDERLRRLLIAALEAFSENQPLVCWKIQSALLKMILFAEEEIDKQIKRMFECLLLVLVAVPCAPFLENYFQFIFGYLR